MLQIFDFCLAPDTAGDGTGCDNMTCIIVTFKKGLIDNQCAANHKRPASEAANHKRPASEAVDEEDRAGDAKRQKSVDG